MRVNGEPCAVKAASTVRLGGEGCSLKEDITLPTRLFAPMPLGESRVQVVDRVKTIFGTIRRDADSSRNNPILDFFIVSHGVTIRAFETAWMHEPWEFSGTLRNPANCSIKLIEGGPGRYGVSTIFDGFRTERPSQQAVREAQGVGPSENANDVP